VLRITLLLLFTVIIRNTVLCLYSHSSDQHYAIEAAANNNISDARPVFDSLEWSEQSYRMFEQIGQTEDHFHFCGLTSDEVLICMHIWFI